VERTGPVAAAVGEKFRLARRQQMPMVDVVAEKTMQVPFLDLKSHHQPHRQEFLDAIADVIDQSAFAGGPFVAAFEEDFARYCGVQHAVGVGNGTDALWLVLLALGVGPGDEVITVPMTFMATAEAISFCGARPVFVDIDERTCTMDPAQLERAITPRTKAIIPVHLYGQMADMNAILDLARRRNIPVLEDACQAHGASFQGRAAGAMGIAGAFSFYPGKNLGAFGEAGAVTTNDGALAGKVKVLREHGQPKKYYHSHIGWNARMDGIQGAVLRIKLKYLEEATERRRAHAARYRELLSDCPELVLPQEAPGRRHVYHLYPVQCERRDEVISEMTKRGIGCAIHYPIPVHLQEAYQSLGWRDGSFPVAERVARRLISLPMFPELTREQVDRVAGELRSVLAVVR
jgi:dTDP-4-amino-4,6-dideoxygalactose transaminase